MLTATPLLLFCIVVCHCVVVPTKRNSLFLKLSCWVIKLPRATSIGVEIRVCGCWMLFIWGGGEGMEDRWYFILKNLGCESASPTPPVSCVTGLLFIAEDSWCQINPQPSWLSCQLWKLQETKGAHRFSLSLLWYSSHWEASVCPTKKVTARNCREIMMV